MLRVAPTRITDPNPYLTGCALDVTTENPAQISQTPVLVSVIVPTYREAENLPILVPRIVRSLADAGLCGEIIIVDDNSNDGTESLCREFARQFPLRLAIRTAERGLSSAVVHGMSMAQGSILVVMDADMSHPPEKIPELISNLQGGETDFVIGSRYVAGAQTDEKWGMFRWLNSKIATILAWPLTSVNDPMAGFFALRRSCFETAAQLDPIGYKIGLELIVKCRCTSIKEVPITFHDRTLGKSKLSLKEQINYLRHLTRLYRYKHEGWVQLIQFLFVGSTGVGVCFLFFTLFMTFLIKEAAWALATGVAMTSNFLLNRNFTFWDSRGRPFFVQYFLYCLTCSVGLIVNWSTFYLLSENVDLFREHEYLAGFAAIVAGTGFNFLFSKYHVFK